MMFVSDSTWGAIRACFTQAEKDSLNSAISGQVICPRGVTVDTDKLDKALLEKIGGMVQSREKKSWGIR